MLDRVLPDYHVQVETLDIDGNHELAKRYGEEIPVLLVNGRKAFKYRVPEVRLRRRLQSWRRDAL